MSFEESYEIASGGLDMGSPGVDEQLVGGWFGAEYGEGRPFRWAAQHAAVAVRLPDSTSCARLNYRMPHGTIGGLDISVRPAHSRAAVWSTRIAWQDGAWHEDRLALALAAGDYVVAFDAEQTWSNPAGRDPAFGTEDRSLGFVLSSLSFDEVA